MTKEEFVEQLIKERDMARAKTASIRSELEQKKKELEYWERQEDALTSAAFRFDLIAESELAA